MEINTERVESVVSMMKQNVKLPTVYYFSHLYGRSEFVRMALQFANINFVFTGFTNAEWTKIKEKIPDIFEWGLPMLQVGSRHLSQTKSIVRYIGMEGNLYPSSNDIESIWLVESIVEGIDDLFSMIIKYHYRQYNLKGGKKVPDTEEERNQYAELLGNSILNTFKIISNILLKKKEENRKIFIIDKMTIADIWICQCRWVLEQPEFIPILDKFGRITPIEEYYNKMKEIYFGKYFETRYGAAGCNEKEEVMKIAECENVKFPFEW